MIATSTPLLGSHFDPITDPWAVADLAELAGRVEAWSARVQQAAALLAQQSADPADVATATQSLIGCGLAVPADTDLTDADQLARVAAKLVASVTDAKLVEQVPAPPSGTGQGLDQYARLGQQSHRACHRADRRRRARAPSTHTGRQRNRRVTRPAQRPAGVADDGLADWIRDIGRVRPAVRSVDDTLAASELTAGSGRRFVVTQAPATASSPWIAVNRGAARASTVLAVEATWGRDGDRPRVRLVVEVLPGKAANPVSRKRWPASRSIPRVRTRGRRR